jgi:hypothetical protein
MSKELSVNAGGQGRASGEDPSAQQSMRNALKPETVARMREVVDYFLKHGKLSRFERQTFKNSYKVYADEKQDDWVRWMHGALILLTIRKIIEEERLKLW